MPHDATDVISRIQEFPGTNLRQLHRATGIPLSTTHRMVRRLEKEGTIVAESEGNRMRYYPAGQGIHKRERILLGFVSKPRPRGILETILANPGIRHSDIAQSVGLPAPTVTFYVKQMLDKDLVLARRKGVEKHFRIKNPDMVSKALERTAGGWDPKTA